MYRILKFHAKNVVLETTGGPLYCLSAKLENLYDRCMFSKFHKNRIWRFMIGKFLLLGQPGLANTNYKRYNL